MSEPTSAGRDSDKTLTFCGVYRGIPGDDAWWDWDVDGVDPRDWTRAELDELHSDAHAFLAERVERRGDAAGAARRVTFTFSRRGMTCNRRERAAAGYR